jgi:hypothetical protein
MRIGQRGPRYVASKIIFAGNYGALRFGPFQPLTAPAAEALHAGAVQAIGFGEHKSIEFSEGPVIRFGEVAAHSGAIVESHTNLAAHDPSTITAIARPATIGPPAPGPGSLVDLLG